MSELYLDSILREAEPPRSTIQRRRYLRVLALPVTLAIVFGLSSIVVDGRWPTGLGFLAAGASIAWVFGKGVEL